MKAVVRYSLALVLFSVSVESRAADLTFWIEKSTDLANGQREFFLWPGGNPDTDMSFYPLGFSKDGWFAYAQDWKPSAVAGKQQFDFSFFNLDCPEDDRRSPHVSQIDKWDKCLFNGSTDTKVLDEYGIRALDRFESGVFPARLLDDEYNIEIGYVENAGYSEVSQFDQRTGRVIDSGPTEPGSDIYLLSKKLGRKRIPRIEHRHSAIAPGSIRPVAWIKSPFQDSIIVLVIAGHSYIGAEHLDVSFTPYSADLKNGFAKE